MVNKKHSYFLANYGDLWQPASEQDTTSPGLSPVQGIFAYV